MRNIQRAGMNSARRRFAVGQGCQTPFGSQTPYSKREAVRAASRRWRGLAFNGCQALLGYRRWCLPVTRCQTQPGRRRWCLTPKGVGHLTQREPSHSKPAAPGPPCYVSRLLKNTTRSVSTNPSARCNAWLCALPSNASDASSMQPACAAHPCTASTSNLAAPCLRYCGST